MRVTVTGGAGFIGSHLVDALVARGDDVVVLDNLHRGRRELVHPAARFIEGDVRDEATLAAAVAGADAVFHLAAQSNVMGAVTGMDYSFTTNVVGTFLALKAASASGARRFVFASSREVYGEQDGIPVPESAPLNAKNPYGASKLAGEAYCRAWRTAGAGGNALGVNVLRFANVYGPRDTQRVIPLWLERVLRGEPLEVYGGQQVLDFVPIGLAVRALLAASETDLDGPVNVGTGVGVPLLELAERIRAVTGAAAPVAMLPGRGAEVVRFVADVTRMRDLLGLEPPADPLEALPETLADVAARTRE